MQDIGRDPAHDLSDSSCGTMGEKNAIRVRSF
jgi:hypothetical protein